MEIAAGTSNNIIGGILFSAVQQVQILGTTGTFQLSFNGDSTGDISVPGDASTVQSASNGLSTIGGVGGFVSVTGFSNTNAGETTTTYTVNFLGTLQYEVLPPLGFSSTGDGGNVDIISQGGFVVAGNVISGNTSDGILVTGAGSDSNKIRGNLIGVNAADNAKLGNGGAGVDVGGGAVGTIVGTDGDGVNDATEGNVISGNSYGVLIQGFGSNNTVIAGNEIGTNASISAGLGNTTYGVFIEATAGPSPSAPMATASAMHLKKM